MSLANICVPWLVSIPWANLDKDEIAFELIYATSDGDIMVVDSHGSGSEESGGVGIWVSYRLGLPSRQSGSASPLAHLQSELRTQYIYKMRHSSVAAKQPHVNLGFSNLPYHRRNYTSFRPFVWEASQYAT